MIKKILHTLTLTILLTFSLSTNSTAGIKLTNQPLLFGIDDKVLTLAKKAYNKVQANGYKQRYLAIVDYSLPSTMPRFWIIDMQTNSVNAHTHVAHGIKSGERYASRFSNTQDSKMSSIGVFITGNVYHGSWGRSLNLHGLEPGFNSNAYQRRIVVHAAPYVPATVKTQLGRSWGCLAFNNQVGQKIINILSKGAVIFAYYPDNEWLKKSRFILP
jgi:hypothetical protein